MQTTLAKIIANKCRSNGSAQFKSLSAATCGVAEVKEIIKVALNNQKMLQIKTVLFLDEIHRFNKAQQVCNCLYKLHMYIVYCLFQLHVYIVYCLFQLHMYIVYCLFKLHMYIVYCLFKLHVYIVYCLFK